MRRIAAALVAVFALSGCTLAQVRAFVGWHESDPASAESWLATDGGQATLDDVDPAPVRAPTSSTKWDAIAMCESGGQWSHPPVTNRYGTFSGGLMIMNSVWRHYGGTEFAALAYQASRSEQIVVAERIRADVGLKAWQCA